LSANRNNLPRQGRATRGALGEWKRFDCGSRSGENRRHVGGKRSAQRKVTAVLTWSVSAQEMANGRGEGIKQPINESQKIRGRKWVISTGGSKRKDRQFEEKERERAGEKTELAAVISS